VSGLKTGKTGAPSKVYPLFGRIPGHRRWFSMIYSLRKFSKDKVAKERLRIIEFSKSMEKKQLKKLLG